MTTCGVAGLSARAMAQSMAAGGFDVVALDCFGDLDTRAASRDWRPIRDPASPAPRIDARALLGQLGALAAQGACAGWIAGGGFEADPALLARAAVTLPLIGCPPAAVEAVRDPRRFFALLDGHHIDHPPVREQAPDDRRGWLRKDARGTGGWAVLEADEAHADDAAAGPHPMAYWQRRGPGMAMSATFVADGRRAVVIGFNRLLSRSFGRRPFVYCGAIGPVAMPPRAAAAVESAVDRLVDAGGLVGLASLDLLLDGDRVSVLECNPRPPATLELHDDRLPGGLMRAHWEACTASRLPDRAALAPVGGAQAVRGSRIVYARRSFLLGPAPAAWLAAQADVRDRPAAGQHFDAGDPVCSVFARGVDAPAVEDMLRQRRRALLDHLETSA